MAKKKTTKKTTKKKAVAKKKGTKRGQCCQLWGPCPPSGVKSRGVKKSGKAQTSKMWAIVTKPAGQEWWDIESTLRNTPFLSKAKATNVLQLVAAHRGGATKWGFVKADVRPDRDPLSSQDEADLHSELGRKIDLGNPQYSFLDRKEAFGDEEVEVIWQGVEWKEPPKKSWWQKLTR